MSTSILQKIKGFSRAQRLVLIAFIVALVVTLFFAYRTYQRAEYWRQHRDEPIAGWMRVGWVANSYHVPPPVLQTAIGLPPDVPDRRPLSKIAEDQGRSFDELKSDLEKAIAEFRADRPNPGANR
ncbi:MAG TPA: hypothetical protein VFZ23_04560 [Pyrinomonadaceae bacterium]